MGGADRTVTTNLVARTAGYDGPIVASSKNTSALASAQRDAAAAAKVAASEQRATALASREAADAAAAAAKQVSAAKAEQAAAAKAAGAADAAAAKAATDADRAEALAAQESARARKVAADEALGAAKSNAAATAETAAASRTAATEAAKDAMAKREVADAAKEAAIAEAADAAATEKAAKERSDAYSKSGKIIMGVGAGMVGVFALAEKATAGFDKSMSGVGAVASATAPQMEQLRAAALKAGADTAFSATQAADAEGELVKAGVSVSDTLNGALMGSLSLAAAGQLDLADAATISANAMNVFGLKGKDVGHIADVLAAAANKSAADVKELAYGLQQGGLVAAQTGLTLEDTTAVLAAFADRGLKGADAGTSMKTMFEKLNAPSGQAAALMGQLGLQTYDAAGKFVGITSLAGQLHDKLGSLTDAQRNQTLATIFGSDAIRGATVLYNLGADGIKGYRDAVNDNGAASRMAAAQMDNLSGDLEQLKGSIETALIKGGSGGTSALRGLTKEATGAVNAFSALPGPIQEAAVGLSGGAGASLLLVGGLTTLGGKVGSTRKTLEELSTSASRMKSVLGNVGSLLTGPWGLAVAGAATVIGIFASGHDKAKIAVNDFTAAIKQDGGAIREATTQAVSDDLAKKGLIARYQQLGVAGNVLTDAVLGSKDALDQVTRATDAAVAASHPQIVASGRQSISINAHADALKKDLATVLAYKDGLTGQIRTTQQGTAAAQDSTVATGMSELATKKAAQSAKDAAAAAFAQAAGQRAVADAELVSSGASDVAATAFRRRALANDDSTAAERAAAEAADAHTAALFKTADSARAAAEAAAKNKGDTADEAKATADAAEAAAEAALAHQTGVKWLQAVADAEAQTAGSARDLDSSVTDEVGAMKDAREKATSLKDALDALNGVHIAASRAAIDVQDKTAGLTKALRENGTVTDITTEKGRANMSAVLDLAQAINSHAQAVTDESGSIEAGNKALDASREQFDAVLKAAGFSKDKIDAFNKSLLNTPKLAEVKVGVDLSAAEAAMKNFASRWGSTGIQVGGGHVLANGYATGGLVGGVGTGTSDSNLIAASRGEFMVKESVVRQPGVLAALTALNGGSTTVVKPQIPLRALAPAPSASTTPGAGLHIENYFENGSSPQAVAAELGWLVRARGAQL